VTTGPGAVKPGAAGTPCSTTKNQVSRFTLTIANPTQGNQIQGGGAGSNYVNDTGYASYNGMVTTLQHRISSDFSLLANWTWSKCLDIVDGQGDIAQTLVQDPYNPRMDWGPCGFDYRDVENTALVARSNFQRFDRVGRALINNWEIAPLIHIASGAAVNVQTGTDVSLTDIVEDRPNRVPGVNPYAKVNFRAGSGEANREYLNPAAFVAAAPGTYGDVGRNAFRTPPFFQFDSQISRIFPLHERLNLDTRLECFNVLNHPNFGSPTATLSSSTFGQISSTASANNFSARVFQGSVKLSF
jgi:hypothetical protein